PYTTLFRSGEAAVAAHRAVAGDGDGELVGGAGAGDRAYRARLADAPRDLRVGRLAAGRDLAQRAPHPFLEGGAAHVQRQVEADARRFDEADHGGDHALVVRVAAHQFGLGEAVLQVARERIRIVAEQDRAHALVAAGDQDRAERALSDRESDAR